MMKFSKKGQGAVEYLQTYGWAILVVIIIGIALWQLGILSPGGRGTNTATRFTKVKVMEPSIKYSSDVVNQSLNFTIVNGVGDLIKINYIGIAGDCNDTLCVDVGSLKPCSEMYLDPGSTMIVEGWNCTSVHSNEMFYVDVNISYSQKLGRQRIEHFDSGIIQGVAE